MAQQPFSGFIFSFLQVVSMRDSPIKPGQRRKAKILGELTTVRVVDALDPKLCYSGQWICKTEPLQKPYLVVEDDLGELLEEPAGDDAPASRSTDRAGRATNHKRPASRG